MKKFLFVINFVLFAGVGISEGIEQNVKGKINSKMDSWMENGAKEWKAKQGKKSAMEKEIDQEISASLGANRKAREQKEKMEQLCINAPNSKQCQNWQAYQEGKTKQGVRQLSGLVEGLTGGAIAKKMQSKEEDRIATKVSRYCEGGEKPNAKLCSIYTKKLEAL